MDATGLFHTQCTGSLVAPDRVLTAKHCAVRGDGDLVLDHAEVYFAVGPDAGAPAALVAVAGVELSEPDAGGVAELGSDVALYRLESAVDGVAPLPLFTGTVSDALLGTELTAYGYGTNVPGCDAGATFSSVRRMGTLILTAVHGNVFDYIYPDYAAFLEDASRDGDPASAERRYANGTLLDDYEVWVTSGQGGAQPCHGDSGGPVLLETDGGMAVAGVVSWSWRSESQQCDYGSVVAVFGPQTRTLLQMPEPQLN